MNISIRSFGVKGKMLLPTIIEVKIESGYSTITEDVADLNGRVCESFLESLRSTLEELEDHNQKLDQQNEEG